VRTFAEIQADREATKTKLRRLHDEIEGIYARASADQNRKLTSGEAERIERLNAAIDKGSDELTKLDDEYRDALRDGVEGGTLAGESGHDTGARVPSARTGRPETREARGRIDAMHRDGLIGDEPARRLTALVERDRMGLTAQMVSAAGDPEYARAFAKLLADPINGHRSFSAKELDAFQRAEAVRSIQVGGGDSVGGYLIPTHLDPAVILSNDGTINPLRAIARVVTLPSPGPNEWNGVTSAGIVAGYAAELAEVGDDSPTFAGPNIPVHKAHAFVQASIEATQDIAGLAADLQVMFRDARDRLEAEKFTLGDGSGEPEGFLFALEAATNSHLEVTTQGQFSAGDVYKLTEALAPRWRARSRFAASVTTLNAIEQMETPNGAKQFPSLPDSLVRRPAHEVSDMPALEQATNATNSMLVYGDFSQFVIVDKMGATIEFIPHLFGTTNSRPIGARGWYLHFRNGSKMILPNAFRLLVDPTA